MTNLACRADPDAVARRLIARYGEQAISVAVLQALRAQKRGDPSAREEWRWIGIAIDQILRSEPGGMDAQLPAMKAATTHNAVPARSASHATIVPRPS